MPIIGHDDRRRRGNRDHLRNGQSGLYEDDQGLIIRNHRGRERRLAWAEISRFDDGMYGGGESAVHWQLIVVLHTGQTVRLPASDEGHPETLAAIRRVAERHGIPADLSGIAMSDGKPPETGLYEDPAGGAGVRYWDGTHWSPLLPPGSYG